MTIYYSRLMVCTYKIRTGLITMYNLQFIFENDSVALKINRFLFDAFRDNFTKNLFSKSFLY